MRDARYEMRDAGCEMRVGGSWIQKFPVPISRIPYPVSRIPYPVSRIPNPASAFTLTELLVVIVIMAALMLIAIPTFQGANRGSRVSTAAFQLYSTLTLARQNAITQRTITHVVVPDNDPPLFAGADEHKDKALRAYAPYSSREGYLGEWKYLPPGVIFHPAFDVPGETKNLFQCNTTPNFVRSIPFPLAASPPKSIFTMAFRPDGVLHQSGIIPVAICLTEGTVDSAMALQYRPGAAVLALDVGNITGRVRSREYLPP